MAGQVSILDDAFVVDAALTDGVSRYAAVVVTDDHTVGYAAAAGAGKFVGITQEDQKYPGMPVNVRILGNSFVKAKGAIDAGDDVCIGDTAGGVDALANVSGGVKIGVALSSAKAAGDLLLITITP